MDNIILNNAHKMAFMIKKYPEKTLADHLKVFVVPAIEINTSLWKAAELGLITEPDKETGICTYLKDPKKWVFGSRVDDLITMLEYAFKELAKTERDLDEVYISNWTLGHEAYDVMIALGYLIETRVLAQYDLTDPEDLKSTYTFTTLYENSEQMWGRKYFIKEPTGEEVPDEDIITTTTTTTQPGQTKLV